jgi:hypothetical protein
MNVALRTKIFENAAKIIVYKNFKQLLTGGKRFWLARH